MQDEIAVAKDLRPAVAVVAVVGAVVAQPAGAVVPDGVGVGLVNISAPADRAPKHV
jgi:hypothetical protein